MIASRLAGVFNSCVPLHNSDVTIEYHRCSRWVGSCENSKRDVVRYKFGDENAKSCESPCSVRAEGVNPGRPQSMASLTTAVPVRKFDSKDGIDSNYETIATLGEGSFGTVAKVRCKADGRVRSKTTWNLEETVIFGHPGADIFGAGSGMQKRQTEEQQNH